MTRKETVMASIRTFVTRHAVLTYFALVFAISWSSTLLMYGPGIFLGTTAVSWAYLPPYLAFLAGPCVAGILLAGLVHGKAGLRDLRSRVFAGRAGVRWYLVAILTAPLLSTVILLALSLISPRFLPAIITANDKAFLVLFGIVAGLMVAILEELGWTGFAIPELRKRHGTVGTGIIVGLVWGAWHYPLFAASASDSGAIPPMLYVATLLFAWLPPYRVLMVWVYDHTISVLLAMLMHLPIVVSQFVLRAEISGADLFTERLVFGAALVVVAVVAVPAALVHRPSAQPLGTA
jgi:uncharacterized protein